MALNLARQTFLAAIHHFSGTTIDLLPARLSYVWTTGLLNAMAILSWSYAHMGYGIDCFGPAHIPSGFLNSFCIMQTTFSIHTTGDFMMKTNLDQFHKMKCFYCRAQE